MRNEWKEHIEQKTAKVPEGRSFIFYTDAHEGDVYPGGMGKGCYESLELVEYTTEAAHIKHVVYGGDVIAVEKTAVETAAYTEKFLSEEGGLYDRFGSDAIVAVGNHDSNCIAWVHTLAKKEGYDPDNKIAEVLVKDSYLYEKYIQPMEASGKVKYDAVGIKAVSDCINKLDIDELKRTYAFLGYDRYVSLDEEGLRRFFLTEMEALFKFHYTYTDDENRMKYIIVDCGTNSPMQYSIIKQDYTDIYHIQFYWLAHELMTAPEGYDIVVGSHMFGGNQKPGCRYEAEDLFGDADGKILDITNITAPLYQILVGFKGNKVIKMPDKNSVRENNAVLKMIVEAIRAAYAEHDHRFAGDTADFTLSRHSGKVITICGHWHNDRLFYVSQDMSLREYQGEQLTDQIPVIFTAAASLSRKGKYIEMSSEPPYSTCFDVVTLTKDKVVLTRIGAGEDREINY